MKTKDQIATKQERILQEKERELATLQKENNELTNKFEKSNESYQKLTEQHNEAKDLLKKNEALINYLNHKLTELQNMQPQQGRLLNGNITLDSSSTTATTNHFRPSSFLVFRLILIIKQNLSYFIFLNDFILDSITQKFSSAKTGKKNIKNDILFSTYS